MIRNLPATGVVRTNRVAGREAAKTEHRTEKSISKQCALGRDRCCLIGFPH